MNLAGKHILISRTDSIGDVMLTLPICAWLRDNEPTIKITFIGKGYTRPIVEAFSAVDNYIDWNDYQSTTKNEQQAAFKALNADVIIHVFPNKEIASLAKRINIPVRIGTSHRVFHFLSCNYKVNFTRKNSILHESQLNHELLRPLGLKVIPTLEQIIETTSLFQPKTTKLPEALSTLEGFTILHPKSQGSAKEWPIEKYIELAELLDKSGRTVVFTGTEEEGKKFRNQIPEGEYIFDTTGKLSLEQLITLIGRAKNLVACSTGPLHISAYLGVRTVGLYVPKRPIHPGRWQALGKNVRILVKDEHCKKCRNGEACNCIESIEVQSVLENLM